MKPDEAYDFRRLSTAGPPGSPAVPLSSAAQDKGTAADTVELAADTVDGTPIDTVELRVVGTTGGTLEATTADAVDGTPADTVELRAAGTTGGTVEGLLAGMAEDTAEDTAVWNQHIPWSQSSTGSLIVVSGPDRVSGAALPAVVRPAGARRSISKKLVLGGALGVVLVGVLLVLLGGPNDPVRPAAPGVAAPLTPAPAGRVPAAGAASLTAETSVTSNTATLTENDLRIKVPAPCTAFDVEIRIVRTPGAQNVGWATTLSDGQATGSVAGENGALLYRFTLKPGITIQPGNYVFEIRYNHDPGAGNQTDNTYAASATQGGTTIAQHLTGHFS